MGERLRAFDWASHPLGPPHDWPPALRMAVSLCLHSSFPTAIYWGPEFHLLYNDAWSVIPAEKHPGILGKPAREAWADIWPIVGPQLQQVFESGEGFAVYEQMLPMVRAGTPRETWWNYSFTAIRNADYSVGGIFNQGNEVTALVHARHERQAEVQRWRELFRQAPAAVALLRGPDHVFEIANDAYLRLVGDRDVVGKPLLEALPEVRSQGFTELLDGVYRSGEPFLGTSSEVKLQRHPGGPVEDCIMDFIYQPVHGADGAVDAVLVFIMDVTDRARAEAALRLSNWQLGEERARLAALVEAEQRARQALRRFNETLEAHVVSRTAELSRALEQQQTVAERLRAAFASELVLQGFLAPDGTLLDANPAALAAIRCSLPDVLGQPFWQTPWFRATPRVAEVVRRAVERARCGKTLRRTMTLTLADGSRSCLVSLRPVRNAAGEVVGLVPEAVESLDRSRASA